MKAEYILTFLVSVVVAVGLSAMFFGPGQDGRPGRDGNDGVGAAAGPALYENIQFLNSFVKAGRTVATTTTAADSSVTMTRTMLDTDVSYITYNAGVNTTLTTMASTSAPFSNMRAGEEISVLFYSATTTAGVTVTIAAGTGVDLQEDEGETVIINGLEVARLTFVKKADSNIIGWVEAGQVGD